MKIEDVVMMPSGEVFDREIVEASYEEWLTYIFGRPHTAGHWRWDEDFIHWSVPALETLSFVIKTFESIGTLSDQFPEDQVADGLDFIGDNSLSNVSMAFRDKTIPWEIRKKAVRSIEKLYSDCFAQRCKKVLGHLGHRGEPPGSELNRVCYMWWDEFRMIGQPEKREYLELDKECLNVMKFALNIDSIPCQESALHGLGHWASAYPDFVKPTIECFIISNPNTRPELIAYARHAQRGEVL